MKTNKSLSQYWLLFMFFILSAPITFLYVGKLYFSNLAKEKNIVSYSEGIWGKLESLRASSDSNTFVCKQFTNIFDGSGGLKSLKDSLEAFIEEYNLKCHYVIFDPTGNPFSSNFDWKRRKGNLELANQTIYKLTVSEEYKEFGEIPKAEYLNLLEIFGPQFSTGRIPFCCTRDNPVLIIADSSGNMPLSWVKISKAAGLFIFIHPSEIERSLAIDYAIENWEKIRAEEGLDFSLSIKQGGKTQSTDLSLVPIIGSIGENLKYSFINYIEKDSNYFFPMYLADDKLAIGSVSKEMVERSFWPYWTKWALALLFCILIFIGCFSYSIIVLGHKPRLSIRVQLVTLFILSNSIPMTILAALSIDYLNDYEISLKEESFNRGMLFLQHVDALGLNEKTYQLKKLESSFGRLNRDLREDGISSKTLNAFIRLQDPAPFKFFLVGSSTERVGYPMGIMDGSKIVSERNSYFSRSPNVQTQVITLGKVGRYLLNRLNRKPIGKKDQTEFEMIVDAMGQKSPHFVLQDYFDAIDRFWKWGFGAKMFPSFVKVFHTSGPKNIFDYTLLYVWNSMQLERLFVKRNLININRNVLGIKVFAIFKDHGDIYPKSATFDQSMEVFVNLLGKQNGRKLETCTWGGEEHIMMGIKCVNLAGVKLLGLFPTDKIKREVKQKLQMFTSFGLVSFLISVSLGLLLSRIILIPIGELQQGVKALKDRRFDYKVKDMGNDEFGSLSRIFNETMNDIEELHVAKFVQEKLLPRMDSSLKSHKLRFYGKTISFDDLGGDYFDVVKVEDGVTGVFVGDVAGHGVAASLIMAFVKACVFMLRPLYKTPVTLVDKINTLFMKTKSKKQRKFMTFQYLLFNDVEASFQYVNAGHCYPIIVNPFRRTADFCEMIHSPLGASKKKIEKELLFALEKGEAVILYSDGFYETGDLGIDGFKEILHKCYDPDPKEYYLKVMSFYQKFFESHEITDDLTLMIITYPAV